MTTRRPVLSFWQLWNMSFGFFGIQIGFALQNANVSRIFQTLGASIDQLPVLWIAGPVTGLLVQPIIGHASDRTWGPLGRRRPFVLAGALLATLALALFPGASMLWMAAGLLWMLDASINIAMEPFRAFVGDMVDETQRTAGYAFQTVFIGAGAVVASLAPAALTRLGVANTAPAGMVPPSVEYAFYLGAAVLLASVVWTSVTTREYSPAQLAAFGEAAADRGPPTAPPPTAAAGAVWIALGLVVMAAVFVLALDKPLYILGGGLVAMGAAQVVNAWRVARGHAGSMLNHILADLSAMPAAMRRLALVQFLSWFALFILWIYATPVVTSQAFGATDTSGAAYNDGADWVGILFAVYNGIAALYAFALPALGRRIGTARLHALNLVAGAVGMVLVAVLHDAHWLMAAMIGIGMAWASILTLPYAMLAGSLPQAKLGVYMGLFNIFIVLPQLMVSAVMGSLSHALYPAHPGISFGIGAACLLGAAALAAATLGRVGGMAPGAATR